MKNSTAYLPENISYIDPKVNNKIKLKVTNSIGCFKTKNNLIDFRFDVHGNVYGF